MVGAVAALLYSNFLLDWALRGFTGMDDVVSWLEVPGQQYATLLRVTDVVCAVLVVSLLPGVRRRLPPGVWRDLFVGLTVVFALGASLAAFIPAPCGPDGPCGVANAVQMTRVHDGSSIVSDTALFLGAAAVWFAVRTVGPLWFKRAAFWVVVLGGIVASLVFGYFERSGVPGPSVGVSQRAHIVSISVWIFCLGLFAARRVDD